VVPAPAAPARAVAPAGGPALLGRAAPAAVTAGELLPPVVPGLVGVVRPAPVAVRVVRPGVPAVAMATVSADPRALVVPEVLALQARPAREVRRVLVPTAVAPAVVGAVPAVAAMAAVRDRPERTVATAGRPVPARPVPVDLLVGRRPVRIVGVCVRTATIVGPRAAPAARTVVRRVRMVAIVGRRAARLAVTVDRRVAMMASAVRVRDRAADHPVVGLPLATAAAAVMTIGAIDVHPAGVRRVAIAPHASRRVGWRSR
jgi:hypothetical protein